MPLFKNLRELIGHPKSQPGLCMIVSEQEGAEIWINAKKTNYVTPKLVAIPQNKEVKVTVELVGHEPHTAWVRSSHKLSYYYCSLKRIPLRLIHNENTDSLSL
jgi:hypothetical protein